MAYRVLVVEDDPKVRSLVCDLLGASGYQVESAVDGLEALEILVERLPDLVLSDVLMPRMSGLELCALLKDNPRTRQLPVIFLTCVDDPVRAFDVGADDFLAKPFRTQELLARVKALLRRVAFLPGLTQEGLRGKLTDLSSVDLLQALHLASASGCLTVVRPHPACRIRLWLVGGRLVAAVLEGEESAVGREAVIALVGWEEGLFSFDSSVSGQWQKVPERDEVAGAWVVDESLEGLLLDAARQKDERNRLPRPAVGPAEAASAVNGVEVPVIEHPSGRPGDLRPTDGQPGVPERPERNIGQLGQRIDEFRNRLRVKALQGIIEGQGQVTSGLVRPAGPRADLDLPPELDDLIERMLTPER